MRVEYINPFVESSIGVLNEVLGLNIRRGGLSLGSRVSAVHEVAIVVGLVGQVEGRVVLDLSKEVALNIVSIMNGEKYSELDEMASATLTELGNMITGRAVTQLSELGYAFDVTPPAIFVGASSIGDANKIEALIVPLEMDFGTITINVALRER